MAALSRPSLRSSSARKDLVPELPATDVPPRSRPTRRRQSKRTRDCSLDDNESNASSKRLKSSPHQQQQQQSPRAKGKLAKNQSITIPIRDKKSLRNASKKSPVTQGSPPTTPPRKSAGAAATAAAVASKHTVPNASINNVHNPPPKTTKQYDGTVSAPLQPQLPPPRPAETSQKNEKRSLRSHDGGSRSKSELAPYFPNYEDLISIEPKIADTITPDTVLQIIDEPGSSSSTTTTTLLSSPSSSMVRPPASSKGKKSVPNGFAQVIEWPEETFTVLTDATRINFSSLKSAGRTPKKDPLDDDIFFQVHSKKEREEKRARNVEKERAMHEKSQLERLIEGLKGHDWLRVMGISGITDGEKKAYEPKRDHLIREVRILLNKFRIWKEEEKRRKVEREAKFESEDDEDGNGDSEEDNEDQDEEDEENEVDEDDDAEEEDNEEEQEEEEEEEEEGEEDPEGGDDDEEEEEGEEQDDELARSEGGVSDGDPPDYSDIDASALQLRLEAARANQPITNSLNTAKQRKFLLKSQPTTYTQQSITTFFSKPYQRQAAVGNHRRGRSKYAFGQPLPEPEEQAFELPDDVLTEEVLAASERKRRAVKRRRGSDDI